MRFASCSITVRSIVSALAITLSMILFPETTNANSKDRCDSWMPPVKIEGSIPESRKTIALALKCIHEIANQRRTSVFVWKSKSKTISFPKTGSISLGELTVSYEAGDILEVTAFGAYTQTLYGEGKESRGGFWHSIRPIGKPKLSTIHAPGLTVSNVADPKQDDRRSYINKAYFKATVDGTATFTLSISSGYQTFFYSPTMIVKIYK